MGVNFNRSQGVDTNNVPPIILQNRMPQQFLAVSACEPDSFQKHKEKNPIMIDPNDKFVKIVDGEPKEFAAKQMVGAKFDPKTAKKVGKELWEWGGKLWTLIEVYDTIDGYRERYNNHNNINSDK